MIGQIIVSNGISPSGLKRAYCQKKHLLLFLYLVFVFVFVFVFVLFWFVCLFVCCCCCFFFFGGGGVCPFLNSNRETSCVDTTTNTLLSIFSLLQTLRLTTVLVSETFTSGFRPWLKNVRCLKLPSLTN